MFPSQTSTAVSSLKNKIEKDQIENNPDLELSKKALLYAGVQSEAFETFISRPADKINLPEIIEAKAEFVYNYFTPDERTRVPEEGVVNLKFSDRSDIHFQLTNEKIPRYVRLTYKTPKINEELIETNLNGSLIEKIETNLDKIVVEGAMSNDIFTGVELLDTGKESNMYSMGKGALFVNKMLDDSDSQKDAVEKLYKTLKEKGGLFGEDKKIIIESLTNIKADGYRLSKSDIDSTTEKYLDDPISKQTFSVQFNNLLMSDIIENSLLVPDNTFQDELRGLRSFSSDIKREIISSIPPANTFREADYDLQVDAIDVSYFDTNSPINVIDSLSINYPIIKFVGYLVEKFEVTNDNETIFLGRKFVPGGKSNFAIDTSVKYGAGYFYKIRTLCNVKTIVSEVNTADSSLDQIAIATLTMASEGKLIPVSCFEEIPPPAPNILKVNFDFKTLKPKLVWDFPNNKQRDIKRFQVFKRLSIYEPFTLIAEIDFDNSEVKSSFPEVAMKKNFYSYNYPKTFYVDNSHIEGEEPIYTICCVDAHALSSNYGPQFKIKRDKYTNKVTTTRVSQSGAPKPYPNMFVNQDAFIDVIKVSNYDRINLFLDPDCYRLTKYARSTIDGTVDSGGSIEEIDLNHLAIDKEKARYTMQLINIDNQKDKIVKIKLQNKASPVVEDESYFEVSKADISQKNVNFQYGIE